MTDRRKKWLISALGTGALLLVFYLIAIPRPVEVEQAIVNRGTFRETIKADGILRSKDRYTVTAFADGDIKRVALKVGDPIKEGEAITELYWDVRYEPVKSPITGVISRLFRESSGPIRRGEAIVEIVNPERLEVVAELLTTDAARLSPGAPASIEGWGGPTAFDAKVVRVSKAGFTKQSALGVEEEKTEVIMDPVELPPSVLNQVGSTFHVDLTIQVSKFDNALKIPAGAAFRDGSDWSVYKIVSGRARKTKVMLGGRGDQEVMIQSGLTQGDAVVLYPGDLVKDGTRIRAKNETT